jgi:hypothetical protein
MSTFEIEAFRPDVDALTDKLTAVIRLETDNLTKVDRSVVVSAALANVACLVDGAVTDIIYDPDGVTGALHRIAAMWYDEARQ